MSSKVTVCDDVPSVTVNVVPLKIQHNGEANTEEFFTPSKLQETIQGKDVTTADFRGLKLVGETIPLEKTTGYICTSSEFLARGEGDDVKMCKQYTSVAKFDALTLFGHDSLPPSDDKWKVLSEWQALSKVLNE